MHPVLDNSTRASIHQPTSRASLTPVSSSCCTGLRHHAAHHRALRHRAPRHPSPSQGAPAPSSPHPDPTRPAARHLSPSLLRAALITSTTPQPRPPHRFPHCRALAHQAPIGANALPPPSQFSHADAPRSAPSLSRPRSPAPLSPPPHRTYTALARCTTHSSTTHSSTTHASTTQCREPSSLLARCHGMYRCTPGRLCVYYALSVLLQCVRSVRTATSIRRCGCPL